MSDNGSSGRSRRGRSADPGARIGSGADGLLAESDGEPLLARWFVLSMVALFVLGIAVTIWAFVEFGGRVESTAADRRPPGTADVTHERGQAVLNEITETEDGVGCAEGITLIGDEGARASTRRALATTCQLLDSGEFPEARAGLDAWIEADGLLRIATFEFTGTESSARVEDDRIVVELSPRFQFANATRGGPFILHELVHMGSGTWPGTPVTAVQEVEATIATDRACGMLSLGDDPPLGCIDAADLLDDVDPVQNFVDAGYERGS